MSVEVKATPNARNMCAGCVLAVGGCLADQATRNLRAAVGICNEAVGEVWGNRVEVRRERVGLWWLTLRRAGKNMTSPKEADERVKAMCAGCIYRLGPWCLIAYSRALRRDMAGPGGVGCSFYRDRAGRQCVVGVNSKGEQNKSTG